MNLPPILRFPSLLLAALLVLGAPTTSLADGPAGAKSDDNRSVVQIHDLRDLPSVVRQALIKSKHFADHLDARPIYTAEGRLILYAKPPVQREFAAYLATLRASARREKAKAPEKLIDLTFENAPLRNALAQVAEAAKANVIVAPDVEGRVTLKLQNVTLHAALAALANAGHLDVAYKDFGIVTVSKARPKPRGDVRLEVAIEHKTRSAGPFKGRILDVQGRPIRGGATVNLNVHKAGPKTFAHLTPNANGKVEIAARRGAGDEQRRVSALRRALHELETAGARREAEAVRKRLADAQAAIEAARRKAGTKQLDRPHTSIEALRRDVHALRGEVRELTGLVRQLLKAQRR